MPPALLLATSDETAHILLVMLLVIAASKLMAEVAERLRQPGVVGELLAGIVIGPAVLGLVQPDAFLAVLSELGVMFLLFKVGLELRDFHLTKVGLDAGLVAIAGVAVPFSAGYWLVRAVGHPEIEAVFVGAAMVATSVGITARVLAGKGLLDHPASKIILAAAVIDDVLGLIVLAMVSSMAKGSVNVAELGLTAALAIGFTFLVAQWGKTTMEKIVPHVTKRVRVGGAMYTLAIVLLFALSLLAMRAGVAAIIGAFLAGMALANSLDHHVHDMVGGATELLVPFFMLGIGLHLDLSPFRDPQLLWIGLTLVVLACVSKLVGCGLGAWRLGAKNAFRVGSGMIPRGEVGMVVAQIGLALGVVPQGVFGLVLLMSIATTMVAPPLLNFAFRGAENELTTPS